ncbi:MAG: hypothetical protein JNN17_14620 [Verrucomicrobiaceae bacterium]|nr:hypothetical protein [Verrucomicrobiaceae bacterium]
MKIIALCLMCLLVGLGAGYGLKTTQVEVEAVEGAVKPDGKAPSASNGAAGAMQAGKGVVNLESLMNDLLKDYDLKSAKKAAADLSVEQLKTALDLLAKKPRSVERDGLRAVLFQAWAVKDMPAAWKAVLADTSDTRGMLAGSVAAVLARSNPKAALEMVQTLGMGGRRTGAIGAVMNEWSKKDVTAAIEHALAHPEVMANYAVSFNKELSSLAEQDPLKAAGLVLRFKDESKRGSMLSSLMEGWIERDPKAAFDWAIAQTNPKLRQEAVAAAVGAWSKSDPKAAMDYVATIPDGEVRQQSFKRAWGDWFKSDPVAATEHLSSIKDSKMLDDVRFYFSYYTEGFTSAERGQLLSRLTDPAFKTRVMDSMSDNLIRKGNYNEAIELLNELPDSISRDRNVCQLSAEWAKNDPAAVSQWLKALPDSSDKDLAVAGYARSLASSDPNAAIAEVMKIPDAKVRDGALNNVAAVWMRSDAKAATAWMATQPGISEADRKMIEMYSRMSGTISIGLPVMVGTRR